ncbi:hypothetical protein BGX24_010289 [Mortierella sp. AD032]|nr:hypothetical protein BGX24_010289 [Mortierella sp. AD032]
MTTDAGLTATQVASSLPEILQTLAVFLSHQELRACVLVCQQWNEVFTPWLWRTIMEHTHSWPRILEQISPLSIRQNQVHEGDDPNTKKDERWLREIFTKHGKHVQDLYISHAALLSNISAAGNVTHLKSLTMQSLTPFRPFEEADALWELPVLKNLQPYEMLMEDQQRTIYASHMLLPVFKDVLRPLPYVVQDVFPRLFMEAQRFCLLVMANPGLESLELDSHVGNLTQFFPRDYIIKMLVSLPRLTRLINHFFHFNLQSLLERLPGIQHYEMSRHVSRYSDETTDDVVLTEPFPGLRSLGLLGLEQVPATCVLNFLEFLPGLEHLTMGALLPMSRESSDLEKSTRCKKYHRLQGFHIIHPAHTVTKELDETIAEFILPCMTFLTAITLRVLMPYTAAVLAEQCKQLESLRVMDSAYSPLPTSSDVRANAPPHNFPALLLHGCPRLKNFFATRHTIYVDKLLERLILTTIDFGFEYIKPQRIKSVETPPLSLSSGAETCEADGRVYIKGYGPTPNSLLLTLASGLDRLRSLRRLKEFGFRGSGFQRTAHVAHLLKQHPSIQRPWMTVEQQVLSCSCINKEDPASGVGDLNFKGSLSLIDSGMVHRGACLYVVP